MFLNIAKVIEIWVKVFKTGLSKICRRQSFTSNFLKAVFHKFDLVQSWISWHICNNNLSAQKIPTDNTFHQTLSQIYTCIKWWIDDAGILQMVSGVNLKLKRYEICTILFTQFSRLRTPYEQCYVSLSSSIHRKMWTSVNVHRFLLSFASDSHLQQAIHIARNVSTFTAQKHEVFH